MSNINHALLHTMPAAHSAVERIQQTPAAHPIRHLRVMSYNIRHGKGMDGLVDLRRIAADIRKADADVIALQEVDRFHLRSGVQDQTSRLAELLGMHAAFAPSLRLGPVQYGNAVLSRYPILDKEVHLLRGGTERRSLLIVRVDLNGQTVSIANTHLGLLAKEKEKQMPVLLEKLDQLEQPAILMGDFNMKPSDPRMQLFSSDWVKSKLRTKHSTHRYGGEIDHIFTHIRGVKTTAWVQPTNASDHYPVVAELEWLVKP